MGIKGLSKFLKDKCPQVYSKVLLKTFAGRTIAIDANNWMHVNMYFAMSKTANDTNFKESDIDRSIVIKNWLDLCINFSAVWLENKITPIFVFDGEYPEEKNDTKEDRKNKKQLLNNEIIDLKNKLHSENLNDNENLNNNIEERLKKISARDTTISKSDIITVQSVLKNLGIPVLIAPGEAEKFCSYMTLRGRADIVFTSDSDALCFGAKIIINKILNMKDSLVQVIILKEVLKSLQLNFDQFVDLCIMAGCDYNVNIPTIGIGKSYLLLKKHDRIENIQLDKECLKYNVCRKLFNHDVEYEIKNEDICFNKQCLIENGRDTLNNFGLSKHMEKLNKVLNPEKKLEDL